MATVNVMSSPYYIIHIHEAMKNIEETEQINSFVPRREKLRNIQVWNEIQRLSHLLRITADLTPLKSK